MAKLTPKEILTAYVSTLSDKKCEEAYQLLTERFDLSKSKNILLNREGIEAKAPEGKVRLKPYQKNRLIEAYGEQGFHILVEIMYDYLDYLEKNTDCVKNGRRKLKDLSMISHYHILGKGWVAEEFMNRYPQGSYQLDEQETQYIDFFDIDNKTQALKYIQQTPVELRYDNQEITYLVNKYDIKENEL